MKLRSRSFLVVPMLLGWNATVRASIPVHEPIMDLAGMDVGRLDVGGAVRVNYINGDYPEDGTDAPQRGGNGGNFELDTFRINVDWQKSDWIGKGEYRWYNGYNMFHTAWLGYNFDTDAQLQVGLNRVPFGVGPYGAANSWFFDLHYYLGLSDDMDIGIKYTRAADRFSFDLAAYVMAEPNGNGATADSARYSYDIIDTADSNSSSNPTAVHGVYSERGQLNGRIILSIGSNSVPTDVGISLQAGILKANNHSAASDAFAYAASVHSSSTVGPWNLKLQCTGYDYGADFNNPTASDDLITMGAYDYAAPVAAKGLVPAATLSYAWDAQRYDWLDSITFFSEASALLKEGKDDAGNDLNNSYMNSIGAAFACGGWYTYVEYASANGNYFVGPGGDFGANAADKWESRFNINFGYYF